jgi:gp23 major capsid protein (fragment)|nr:MAG TPA: Major capsid protein [Ackermannviridae sp.]
MKEFLTSGQVGNIELNMQKKIREDIQKRWDSLGFTEGLEGAIKENVATLYENEAKHLISEATASDNSGSFETVVFPIIRRVFSKLLANDVVSVQAMNLPVGKLFFLLPVTSQREFMYPDGQQHDPADIVDGTTGRHTGLMGYDRVNRNKEGRVEPRYYLPDEVVKDLDKEKWYVPQLGQEPKDGTTYANALAAAQAKKLGVEALRQAGPEVTEYFEKSLYDLFYNDFLYDNSKGKVTLKVGNALPVVRTAVGMRPFTGTDLKDYERSGFDGTIRNVILQIDGFSAFNAGRLTGPDGNEMDTEGFLASLKVITMKEIASQQIAGGNVQTAAFKKYESVPFRVATQKYGKGIVEYGSLCDAEGKMYIELDLAKTCAQQAGTIDGYVGVDADQLTAAVDATNEETTKQNMAALFKVAWAQYDSLELETEIGEVSFKMDAVTVSVEERKLRATWSPELAQDVSAFHNIDAEAELTAILSEQIAAEIDREILRDLRKGAPWQARWDVNGWRRMAAFSTNYTQKDWNQELMTKVNQISAQIHKSTLRGGANFIVVSSEISALFDNLEYFHVSDASAESDQYNMGIERIGALSGRYQVYRDPYAPHWSIIIGHKGKSLLDTGYIYAPYVPMSLTPTMFNPFNFAPVKGIMTRYAKKMVNNRYYGHIRVDGLVHWPISEFR